MRARLAAAAVLVTVLSAAVPARGDELTPRKQALLLLRVLVYDRNLKSRAGDAVRVAVAFRAGDRRSEEERDQLVAALEQVSREVVALGLPVAVGALPYRDAADFEARLGRSTPACMIVCASLDPEVKEIARAARRRSVLSLSPSRRMAEAGLAIALVNRGRRAGVVVNLPAARAEGADLDAALLSIAEVLPSPAETAAPAPATARAPR